MTDKQRDEKLKDRRAYRQTLIQKINDLGDKLKHVEDVIGGLTKVLDEPK